MYYNDSDEDLRAFCRNSIETLEIWARNLIHEKLSAKYGENYFDVKNKNNENIIRSTIVNKSRALYDTEPSRFKRLVDTLFFDDIIYILCKQELYQELFKSALDYVYPVGKEEAYDFLSRIVPIRNALSHSNPISIRQAEQAICYTHDFIEGIKAYYKSMGEERIWNVPTIVKLTDSLGNAFEKDSNFPKVELRVGDTYAITAEIDNSFDRSSYKIEWLTANNHELVCIEDNNRFVWRFTIDDVNSMFAIQCHVISNKTWHKFGRYDDFRIIYVPVLPPFEEVT